MQSIDPKVESLHPKKWKSNQGELKSQRDSFKQHSLFKKGPVVVHHRSLALSNAAKDDKKNSSVIQNRLAVNYQSNQHTKHAK